MATMNGLRSVPNLVVAGEMVPNRLASYLFWRDVFYGRIPEYIELVGMFQAHGFVFPGELDHFMAVIQTLYGITGCSWCGGSGTRYDKHGYYYCYCELLKMRSTLESEAEEISSKWDRKTIQEMKEEQDTPVRLDVLRKLKTKLSGYIESPHGSYVLQGPPGVGKSHILQAIVTAWHPWFIYVVASDFENRLRALWARELDGEHGLIGDYMNKLINWPGVAFDDLGIEYGTPWIMQKLEDFFEMRLRDAVWADRLTVVGTNIRKTAIKTRFQRDGVSRIGSRLLDKDKVNWSGWLDILDYRDHK